MVRNSALAFIVLMGIVSLFSDMTHEGARSIYGAYLGLAGASAAVIGFVSGLGEFIGYSFRIVTGYIADRLKNYWFLSIAGYVVNMLAIPLLALIPENGWKYACILIVLERMGKAIRQPSKNTLVSFAATQVGEGKAFAIQEFLDQIGAFCGPLLLFIIMLVTKGDDLFFVYRICFLVLLIPACLTIFFLLKAKRKFPHPELFETESDTDKKFKMNTPFFIYITAISLFAFGFLDFPLITMHVAKKAVISETFLPLLYAGAMFVDAFAALAWGWMYDKYGIIVLALSVFLSSFFSIFIFQYHSVASICMGVLLWGIGMGAQESILKSMVTHLVQKKSRSTGFGIFETSFGICWFAGSWTLGILYDYSIAWMIAVSVLTQLAALPLLFILVKRYKL